MSDKLINLIQLGNFFNKLKTYFSNVTQDIVEQSKVPNIIQCSIPELCFMQQNGLLTPGQEYQIVYAPNQLTCDLLYLYRIKNSSNIYITVKAETPTSLYKVSKGLYDNQDNRMEFDMCFDIHESSDQQTPNYDNLSSVSNIFSIERIDDNKFDIISKADGKTIATLTGTESIDVLFTNYEIVITWMKDSYDNEAPFDFYNYGYMLNEATINFLVEIFDDYGDVIHPESVLPFMGVIDNNSGNIISISSNATHSLKNNKIKFIKNYSNKPTAFTCYCGIYEYASSDKNYKSFNNTINIYTDDTNTILTNVICIGANNNISVLDDYNTITYGNDNIINSVSAARVTNNIVIGDNNLLENSYISFNFVANIRNISINSSTLKNTVMNVDKFVSYIMYNSTLNNLQYELLGYVDIKHCNIQGIPTKADRVLLYDSSLAYITGNYMCFNYDTIAGPAGTLIDCNDKLLNGGYYNMLMKYSNAEATKVILKPNVFYIWELPAEYPHHLVINFEQNESNITNEYLFQFRVGNNPFTIVLPDTIKWHDNRPLYIEPNTTYQVSIVNDIAVYVKCV